MLETALQKKNRIFRTIRSLLLYNILFVVGILLLAYLVPPGKYHEALMRTGIMFWVFLLIPYNNNGLSLWVALLVSFPPVIMSIFGYNWLAYGFYEYDSSVKLSNLTMFVGLLAIGANSFISYAVTKLFYREFRFSRALNDEKEPL